jgi:hypothetical protein
MNTSMRKSPAIIKAPAATENPQSVLTGPKALLGARDGSPARAGHGEPDIKLKKDGALIEAIEITCPCGNHMVIECLYDPRTAEITP